MAIGKITRIEKIEDGPKPQMGPDYARSITLVVQAAGTEVVELTEDAARDLLKQLAAHLEKRS